MARIIVKPGRITFKLDTGETDGGKPVYRSLSMGGVKGDAGADALAAVAEAIETLVPQGAEETSLVRSEILDYK